MKILINPRLPQEQSNNIKRLLETVDLPDHTWVATSGTTSQVSKWVGLSQKAIEASAKAVNQHLESDSKDVWLHALPDFHVGGLGIYVRALLSDSLVVKCSDDWNPIKYHRLAIDSNATLSALVPAQLFDLVQAELKAPVTLRATVIGGGALNEALYFKAREYGWNPIPSFGFSECASQVATASLSSLEKNCFPDLQILSHIQATDVDASKRLRVKSNALLTFYAFIDTDGVKTIDPKQDGWFQSEDIVDLHGNNLSPLGRIDDFVKVGGESVNIAQLNKILDALKLETGAKGDYAIHASPSERLGHEIHLVAAQSSPESLSMLLEEYHKQTLPFEKVREIHHVAQIPRTDLKKLKLNQIFKGNDR